MAVKKYTPRSSTIYIGLSSDTKPGSAATSGVQAGDKFIETDTSKVYIFDTTGNWIVIGTTATAVVAV